MQSNQDVGRFDVAVDDAFNPSAAGAVQWTRSQLSEDDRKWLRGLPYVIELAGFTIVHATLNRPERWEYVFDKLAAEEHFQHQTTSVCFFGHTHVPVAFASDSMVHGGTYSKFKVEKGRRYFVNVGSLGQPRDATAKASYAIYDLDDRSIRLRRLHYPKPDSGEGGRPPGPVPVRRPPSGGPPYFSAENSIE